MASLRFGMALSLALLSSLQAQVPALSLKTFAGSGRAGSADGNGSSASFSGPQAVAADANGNLYVASLDNTIRKITPQGVVITLAGAAGQSGTADGNGTSARFTHPGAVAIDNGGSVYVADTLNFAVRKITPDGRVTTLAGPSANLANPSGIAVDATGNVFIADSATSTIRKITSQGTTVFAGRLYVEGFLDGAASEARFKSPQGLALDGQGNLYVADSGNHAIRKITPDGTVSTVATAIGNPVALSVDASGNLYVADEANCLILGITSSGSVAVVAGAAGSRGYRDSDGSAARLTVPCGIAVMPSGSVAIVDWEINAIRVASVLSTAPVAPRIEQQPASVATSSGARSTFSVVAFGYPSPTYQWYRNGVPIGSATGKMADYIDYSTQPSDAGTYTVVVSNSGGTITSDPASLTVGGGSAGTTSGLPTILSSPSPQTIQAGGSVTLSVSASGATSFQWQLDGVSIPEATASTLTLSNVGATQAGKYTVIVSNSNGSQTTAAGVLTVTTDAHLVNLSTRAWVGTGARAFVAGFVVEGSGEKQILVRGVGPTLASFGIRDVLAAPQLTLFGNGGTPLASATAWNSSLAALMSQVGAFPLPTGSADSAVSDVLTGGAYSAQVTGMGGTSGVALLEIYDAGTSAGVTQDRLVNLSSRAFVGTGDSALTAGFVVSGTTSETLLIRAVGPGLSAFGVTEALPAAQLSVADKNGSTVASNSNWGGDPSLSAAFSRAGAFALAPDSSDSALVVTLPPGAYTAQVTGQSNSTGVALIEIYELR